MARDSSPKPIPPALQDALKQFEAWRTSPTKGRSIPDELWSLALSLAVEFGAYRTARSLRLDYSSLKKRLDACEAEPPKQEKTTPEKASPFCELRPATHSLSTKCILEFEDRGGAKMRVHLEALDASALATIVRGFLRADA